MESESSKPSDYDPLCINCWSAPRCCSTSLLYSFAQRPDTTVLDEPLYANYLKLTGLPRPYREQVLAAQDPDGNAVVSRLLLGPRSRPVLYAKHMGKHKVGITGELFRRAQHVILIREPYGVLQSFSNVLEPTQQELGYTALLEIASELRVLGRQAIVINSDELIRQPAGVLRALCAALGLAWDPRMLSWAPGPKPYDGLWADWWYRNTHRSSGFAEEIRESRKPLPDHLKPLLAECYPLYDILARQALRPLAPDAEGPEGRVPRPLAAPSPRRPPPPDQHHQQSQQQQQLQQQQQQPLAKTVTPPLPLSVSADSSDEEGEGAAAAAPQPPPPQAEADSAAPSAPIPGIGIEAQADGCGRADKDRDGMLAATEKDKDPKEKDGGGARSGTHAYVHNPRNDDVLVGIRDGVTGRFELVWRPQARVSVLDSGYMLGDGVWEGIRLHNGTLLLGEEHFERLAEGAKAIDMELGMSLQQLQQLVYDTVDANGMTSGVHIRLMVTRGLKPTPYQNPKITIGQPTIVVIPEYKEPSPVPLERGIRLFTVHVRRGNPDVQDPGWNSHSKLNCIAACIQANKAGVDEALMLDPQGFVATCNSTNFFIVRKGEVWAPSPRHQLRGITRDRILKLCRHHDIPCRETDFYLTQVYSADEAFVTGTFAGVIPVVEVDGRVVGSGRRGPLVARLQGLYAAFVEGYCAGGRRTLDTA